jgi:ABC-type branched-subunit amino acid transport system ATPase component
MQATTLMDVKREHKGVTRTFQNRKMFETKRMHDRTMAATNNKKDVSEVRNLAENFE